MCECIFILVPRSRKNVLIISEVISYYGSIFLAPSRENTWPFCLVQVGESPELSKSSHLRPWATLPRNGHVTRKSTRIQNIARGQVVIQDQTLIGKKASLYNGEHAYSETSRGKPYVGRRTICNQACTRTSDVFNNSSVINLVYKISPV